MLISLSSLWKDQIFLALYDDSIYEGHKHTERTLKNALYLSVSNIELEIELCLVFALRKYSHTISVRLSDEDKQRYERLLKRFGKTWRASKSASFRELLKRLGEELAFETRWDNPGFDSLPEQSSEERSEAPTQELVESL
jgi:hypothetical protein